MYRWVIFLHVLAALAFFLAHGASAAAAFQFKKEKELTRIQALLTVSGSSLTTMFVALLVLLIAGIVAGFMGQWWRYGWIWTSLGLLIGLTVWMWAYSRSYYTPLRKAAGMPYMEGNKPQPAVEAASDEEIAAVIDGTNPMLLTAISFGVTAIILWLMMFKPF